VRSFIELQRADPGYDPNNVLTFFVNPAFDRWNGPQRGVFMQTLRERIAAMPGVQAVTAASPLPLDGTPNVGARWGKAEALTDPNLFQQASTYFVMPGYFEAMRTRLIEGRTFTEDDNTPEAMLIVVDERLAARAFPGESAVGQRILARIRTDEPEWFEIIGVVTHQRHESLAADGREATYFTDGILGWGAAQRWAVRTTGDPSRMAAGIRAAIAEVDPLQAVADVQPMQALVDRATAPTRFALALIGIFSAIAALLAAIGLYGVLATMVRQRTAEIGVRMAFGAPRSSIFQLIVGQGLRLSAAGIGIGLLAAGALTRVMRSMLVGVTPTDTVTYATMAALFFVIAVIACFLPAHRAARLEPTVALRDE
jgi:predicted permease